MSVLDTIVAHKKKEVESCREIIPEEKLREMPFYERSVLNFKKNILDPARTGIIAEFKRQSPSKGIINAASKVEEVTTGYNEHGASALSVLTDHNFFGGSVDDLIRARNMNVNIPILRKEFIIDPYQVHEAKAIGADAILLIASILEDVEAEELAALAHDLGLQVLLELHESDELILLDRVKPDVVGVNNRNLKSFEVDLEHSVRLAKGIPAHFVRISESGISTANDIKYLKKHGFEGFLIGENFMKTPDPVSAFIAFVNDLK